MQNLAYAVEDSVLRVFYQPNHKREPMQVHPGVGVVNKKVVSPYTMHSILSSKKGVDFCNSASLLCTINSSPFNILDTAYILSMGKPHIFNTSWSDDGTISSIESPSGAAEPVYPTNINLFSACQSGTQLRRLLLPGTSSRLTNEKIRRIRDCVMMLRAMLI